MAAGSPALSLQGYVMDPPLCTAYSYSAQDLGVMRLIDKNYR